jgi:hypothetical protein
MTGVSLNELSVRIAEPSHFETSSSWLPWASHVADPSSRSCNQATCPTPLLQPGDLGPQLGDRGLELGRTLPGCRPDPTRPRAPSRPRGPGAVPPGRRPRSRAPDGRVHRKASGRADGSVAASIRLRNTEA